MRQLHCRFVVGLVLTMIALADVPSAVAFVTDGSFELPSLPANTYLYNPLGSPWTYSGNSGVIYPSSAFGSPAAPAGNQVAFLQTDSLSAANFGQFSQPITLPSTGTYTLSYLDAGRSLGIYQGNVAYEVLLDTTLLATPATTSGQPFTSQSFSFTSTVGPHVLTFRVSATQPLGDDTAFFDNVVIVPEPATPLGMGLTTLWFLGRSRRRGRSAGIGS